MAQTKCEELGASVGLTAKLASIHSEEENDFITTHYTDGITSIVQIGLQQVAGKCIVHKFVAIWHYIIV